MTNVITIGHSNHSPARFAALLAEHAVEVLVDVRSRPYSRYVTHACRRPLEQAMTAAGIEYVFLGAALGGLEEVAQPKFDAGMDQLLELARDRRVAIMCAEEDPTRCHRRRLLVPALRERGVEVAHIRGDGRLQPDADLDPPQLALFET